MSKYDTRIRILSYLVVIVIIFIGFSTYAYFNKKVNSIVEFEENNVDDKISVVFTDTSNIALVNAKNGDEINKSFTVKNLSNNVIYYDVMFSNLINNFKELGDLTYSLVGSKNAAYVTNVYVPKDNSIISTNIKLDKGEEHFYVLNIKVANSDEINKTFSTNIKVDVLDKQNGYENGSIGYNILSNNNIYSERENNSQELNEGLFYTNNSINGSTVYYFKGSNNLKNNVLIGNMCFKVLRTTEDNGIRMIYNGEIIDGICNNENKIVGVSEFNTKSDYNAYIGYMYGTPNSSSYEREHENINSSKLKTNIDSFYLSKLKNYSSLIQNSTYCNNRKTNSFTINNVLYGTNGYNVDNTGYQSAYRLLNNSATFNCDNKNDRLNSEILSNPIGVITAEEAYYTGLDVTDNYLYSKDSYWTMSPAYYNGINAYNYVVKDNKLVYDRVDSKHGIRPVITIKGNTMVKRGNGSIDNPYVID